MIEHGKRYTVKEVIEMSKRSRSQVYKDIQNGLLTKFGRCVVGDDLLVDYLDSSKRKYNPPVRAILKGKSSKRVGGTFEDLEKELLSVVTSALCYYQSIPLGKLIKSPVDNKAYREWIKIAASITTKNRELKLKGQEQSNNSVAVYKGIMEDICNGIENRQREV